MDNWTCIGNIGRGGFGNVQLYQNKVSQFLNTILFHLGFSQIYISHESYFLRKYHCYQNRSTYYK